MSRKAPSDTALRVSDLPGSAPTPFALRPDADACRALADALELSALRKVSFEGRVRPMGRDDWLLEGRLGATAVQPCVVTLAPVTTRIDTDVRRVFVSQIAQPDEAEVEMPEDDEVEPLGAWIDPSDVLREALALALPDYPRSEGADLTERQFTEPGKAAMTDDDAKPFAGLAALKGKLDGSG